MPGRRGDRHRLIRWLWTSHRLDARLARAGLLPLAALWRAGMGARNLAYDRGWLAVHDLPLPAVAVGNLTVGGSGKTPLASWIATHYLERGLIPGILLRGYGRDEVLVHQHAVPLARVVADPDRVAAAHRAQELGAQVLVLDDAFQRRDVWRDLNLLVLSAETSRAVPWPLPAGPWREGWPALARANGLIVTRKRADAEDALECARRLGPRIRGPVAVVHLAVRQYAGMVSGRRVPAAFLEGKRVVAASAIADPEAFIAQTKADHVVLTEKDAVKLRDRWPASVPEPLVAALDLVWEQGERELVAALDALVTPLQPL